jgi:hypothetical protein
MATETPAPLVPNELAVAWDAIVAPRAAFTALRERPRWLVAYVITCVLGMIGALLQAPAGVHIAENMIQKMIATDPNIAAMSPDKQQALMAQTVGIQHYVWLFYPVIIIIALALTAVVLLVARAIGRGNAGYGRLFAVAALAGIVNFGIAYLYIGIIVTLKGGANFDTQRELFAVLPSLAWLVPGAGLRLAAFLAAFSVFSIWAAYLIMLGLEIVAGVSRRIALSTVVVLLLLSGSITALTAR